MQYGVGHPGLEGHQGSLGAPLLQRYFLFGRCVSAEAAAVFAAGLDFGLLSTFDAADAAFALVTSLFDFAMLITSFLTSHVWAVHKMVDSILTKALCSHTFIDENVGFFAKQKGREAQEHPTISSQYRGYNRRVNCR